MSNHQAKSPSSSSSVNDFQNAGRSGSSTHHEGGNNDLSLRSLLAARPSSQTRVGMPPMTRNFLLPTIDATTASLFSNQHLVRTPEEHKANLARILQAALDMVEDDDDDDDWIVAPDSSSSSSLETDFAWNNDDRRPNQQQQ
jgi:hypothetical protein